MKKYQIYCNGILLIIDIDTAAEAVRLLKELKHNRILKKSVYTLAFEEVKLKQSWHSLQNANPSADVIISAGLIKEK